MEIYKIETSEAKTVSEIINQSFQRQAEILQITEQDCPHYVAFEKPEAVVRSIENGEFIYLLKNLQKVPVGTIRFNVDHDIKHKGYINRLAVRPEYRKNQYGKILMDFAEKELKEKGFSVIELSIVKQFERLQEYYLSLGYKITVDKKFPFFPFECRYLEKMI